MNASELTQTTLSASLKPEEPGVRSESEVNDPASLRSIRDCDSASKFLESAHSAESPETYPRFSLSAMVWHRAWPWLKWLGLTLALIFALSLLARTRLVVGPLVASELRSMAQKSGADLYVHSIRPSGWVGLRLEGVRVRSARGPYAIDARLHSVELTPDWGAFFDRGAIRPDKVLLDGGRVVVERRPELARSSQKSQTHPAQAPLSEGERHRAPQTGSLRELVSLPHAIGFEARNLAVELRAGRSFTSVRPVQISTLNAAFEPSHALVPLHIEAHGKLPDGVSFWLKSRPKPGGAGTEYSLFPESPTRLDAWFVHQLPFEMSTGPIRACVGCRADVIDFEDVSVRLPNFRSGVRFSVPSAQVVWHQNSATLNFPQAHLASLSQKDGPVDVTRNLVVFDTTSGTSSGQMDLRDVLGGRLVLEWIWDAPQMLLSAEVRAEGFSANGLLSVLDLNRVLGAGELHGTFRSTIDVAHRILEATAEMDVRRGALSWEAVGPDLLYFGDFGLEAHLVWDIAGASFSLVRGALKLPRNPAFEVEGHLTHASQGWWFDAHFHAEHLRPEPLRDALPAALIQPLKATKMEGDFDVSLVARGHTAFPESFQLQPRFRGGVLVLEDDPHFDVQAFAEKGPPARPPFQPARPPLSFDPEQNEDPMPGPPISEKSFEAVQFDWVEIATLPSPIVQTLLAAEDTAFYTHSGFDWRGLERAFEHNLEVGRLERGGSTLSQQVAKNLFLSPDRTAARKIQEAYFTWRLEDELDKERILELYLNIAEWGPNLRGLGLAAQRYFGIEASELTVPQMALLAAILPNPHRFGDQLMGGWLAWSRVVKFEHIMSNLRFMKIITPGDYKNLMDDAYAGQIAGLSLRYCKDESTAPDNTPACD